MASGKENIYLFIEEWAKKGVYFSAQDGALKVSAPKGAVAPQDAQEIKGRKPEILDALKNAGAPVSSEIEKVDRAIAHPLGLVQQRIWAHEQMQPGSTLYQIPSAWWFSGPLDFDAFIRAFNGVIERHEILRARFETNDGIPVQAIVSPKKYELPFCDLSSLPEGESEKRLQAHLLEAQGTPLDLSDGEVFRAHLFKLSADRHLFFFMPHHLVWDGWCFEVFLQDLSTLYEAAVNGTADNLPPLAAQFLDYAQWHRKWVDSAALEKELAYWMGALSAETPPLDFATDKPRPSLYSHDGETVRFEIDQLVSEKLKSFSADRNCTAFTVVLAAWQSFLMRIIGQSDIVVGVPVHARQHEAMSGVIGCFVNTLCLRGKIERTMTFSEILSQAADVTTQGLEHQNAPIELIAEQLVGHRDPSQTPLFQTMFTYQRRDTQPTKWGALEITECDLLPNGAAVDLELEIFDLGDSVHGELIYCSALFARETIEHYVDCFKTFLGALLDAPEQPIGDVEILSQHARLTLEQDWNPPRSKYQRESLAFQYFETVAHQIADKTAIICDGQTISFDDLSVRSNKIANYLQQAGIGAGDYVGVVLERSIDMVAVMLGIWKAGAAYLPLDPSFPESRLRYMLNDAGAKMVVASDDTCDVIPEITTRIINLDEEDEEIDAASGDEVPIASWDAENPAYIIYTSGSTGRPKGVVNSHRALCNFLESMISVPGISPDDRLLAVTTISFDISILEIFLPLSVGATLVIATADDVIDGITLCDLIDDLEISILQATPATWRLLLDAEWKGAPKLKALCGGEPLPPTLAKEILPRVASLWNMYGPTETTIWSTCEKIETPDDINVGRPIANTIIKVLDRDHRLVPIGVAGDLWIGGDGVAIGYHNRPDITAERFVTGTDGNARLYNTGDRARWRFDGKLEILGRDDNQVKLRGYRIELGEIETSIEAHDKVAQAAATVHTDTDGEASLVAYVVFEGGEQATGSELRKWLRRSLPQYMIPQFFVPLSALPLTNNNKIDRKALPAPSGQAPRQSRIAPRSELEINIANVWSDLLRVSDISVTDNFFELGGQSLQVAQMVARLREHQGILISPRAVIFETLEQLADGAETGAKR
ncbi:amino acid adenylation domain-containing protein [Hyphococcus formosus]|uniref:non-ribosomal peptide synthetase n=1 Tax=Hyphococcus formosus TaxID=3143534 RepID=UPI00398AFD2F